MGGYDSFLKLRGAEAPLVLTMKEKQASNRSSGRPVENAHIENFNTETP
jgi:hypothetical protein